MAITALFSNDPQFTLPTEALGELSFKHLGMGGMDKLAYKAETREFIDSLIRQVGRKADGAELTAEEVAQLTEAERETFAALHLTENEATFRESISTIEEVDGKRVNKMTKGEMIAARNEGESAQSYLHRLYVLWYERWTERIKKILGPLNFVNPLKNFSSSLQDSLKTAGISSWNLGNQLNAVRATLPDTGWSARSAVLSSLNKPNAVTEAARGWSAQSAALAALTKQNDLTRAAKGWSAQSVAEAANAFNEQHKLAAAAHGWGSPRSAITDAARGAFQPSLADTSSKLQEDTWRLGLSSKALSSSSSLSSPPLMDETNGHLKNMAGLLDEVKSLAVGMGDTVKDVSDVARQFIVDFKIASDTIGQKISDVSDDARKFIDEFKVSAKKADKTAQIALGIALMALIFQPLQSGYYEYGNSQNAKAQLEAVKGLAGQLGDIQALAALQSAAAVQMQLNAGQLAELNKALVKLSESVDALKAAQEKTVK